jgi:hypothetical protein
MLQLVPIGDWSDDATGSKRCRGGNHGEVRVCDACAAWLHNVKPIGVQTIGVCAIFGHWHVAEKLACLALSLSTWANSVAVAFWFFFAVTQRAYVVGTQMASW